MKLRSAVIPEPRRLTAGPVARLPPELVIAGVADGLSEAARAIATALRAAGMTASAVRLHGVIDDFVALNATSAVLPWRGANACFSDSE